MPQAGSPPQVRGKLECGYYDTHTLGITPAGAGKTLQSFSMKAVKKDHPRRCGENMIASVLLLPLKGSPPQVRGKPADMAASPQVTRITPAGAGKTPTADGSAAAM